MFNSYGLEPREAIATVLDCDEGDTCATVKITTETVAFAIEYLNHPDDDGAVYNVTTAALPEGDLEGFTIEDSGPGYTVLEADAETVDGICEEIRHLAVTSGGGGVELTAAKTKYVTAKSWDPTLWESIVTLGQFLNPLADDPDV